MFFLRHSVPEKMVEQHVFKIHASTHSCRLYLERIYVPLKRSVACEICYHQGALGVCTFSLNAGGFRCRLVTTISLVSGQVWD